MNSWQVKGTFIFVTDAPSKKAALEEAKQFFKTSDPRLKAAELNWTAFSRKKPDSDKRVQKDGSQQ